MEISMLSSVYDVRKLGEPDVDEILNMCRQNTQFYEYCEAEPSREQILSDMHITPPGTDQSRKYYIGFFDGDELIAVMDLIDGYPDKKTAYIGFFMMNRAFQGRNIGMFIIGETAAYLKTLGKSKIMLGIDKDNPQSVHFWGKNGFSVTREVRRNGWTVLAAEKYL